MVTRLLFAVAFACVGIALGAVHNPLVAQIAGERITGTVMTQGAQPVPDARVTVVGTNLGAVSGSDGRYAIAGVAPGSYTVRAQRIGYAPQSRAIKIGRAHV